MTAFDYIREELDRIETGCVSADGTKPVMLTDDIRELIDNAERNYHRDFYNRTIERLKKKLEELDE